MWLDALLLKEVEHFKFGVALAQQVVQMGVHHLEHASHTPSYQDEHVLVGPAHIEHCLVCVRTIKVCHHDAPVAAWTGWLQMPPQELHYVVCAVRPLWSYLGGKEAELTLVSASAETDEHVIQSLLDDSPSLEKHF